MVSIEKVFKVTTTDGKRTWFPPPDTIKEVDEKTFVALPRKAKGFASLVFYKNQNIPDPLPAGYSLSASQGYVELCKLRKEAAKEAQIENSGVSALFHKSLKAAKPKGFEVRLERR